MFTPPPSLRSIVTVSTDQLSCDLAGEAAMLHLSSGVYYTLDRVGARIWTLLAHPTTAAAIRDLLVTEYQVEPDRCERELLDLLAKLHEGGLIESRDGTPD